MKKYRLFLYRPLAANYLVDTNDYDNEFLGELKADNVKVAIKLQDFSSLNFTLPDNILGEFNTRVDEVLDNYIVELWYGNLNGVVDVDYFRYRFIIVKSPLAYQNGVRVYSYEAQSLEFLLEQKRLNSWPGVQVKDFYRSIKYNKLSGSSARFTESPAAGVTLSPYTLSTSTYVQSNNVARTRYITVPTTTGTVAGKEPTVFDIFIYQKRFSNEDGLVKESSLIEFDGTVNDEGFKPGFYVPVLNEDDKVTALQISLPNDLSYFTQENKDFEILLYDNPTYRHFAVGINTDQEVSASDMYLDLAQDEPVKFTIDLRAKIGEPFLVNSFQDRNFNKLIKGQKIEGNNIPANSVITRVVINSQKSNESFIQISNNISGSGSNVITIRNINISSINIAEYGDYAFSAQMIYSKNGLKLRHVLNGTTDELEDPEEPGEQEITPDGILYDTGFTIGEIHESIESKYRSNIDLNNSTKYQAIKDIAESFDCIAVFNSIDNTVSFYPDKNEEIFDNNGLIITDKNYLTNISNDINALKIVTKAYAAGKNNLGIELISPNGSNAWEDYSYFLDSYYVEFDIQNILDISLNTITGIEFDNFPEGDLSRWMPQDEARAIAKWQYARDSFHELMLGNVTATGDISYLMRYYNLYNIRSRGIDLLVKLESKYYERKATEYNLKYLYDFYVKDNENKTDAASRKKNLVYNFKNTTTFPVTTVLPSGDFVFNSSNFTTVTKITIANVDNKSPGENARTFLASININNNPLLILSINSTDTNFVYYSVKGVDSVNTNSTQVVLDVEYSTQPGSDPLPTTYENLTNITFRFRTWEEIYLIKYNEAKSASESAIKSLNRLSYILYNYRLDGTKIIPSDLDYAELSAVQENSIATKMGEVQNYLRKSNWGIDEEKIKFFQREAVMSDSKLDNELDLINATREFLVENCRPIVTLSINIADFLASEQAILDWNRAKIGDIINIYYPEFNIDTTAQIRELNIDFQGNALSFTISTYRYYGRQPLYFLSKQIRNLYDNEKNKTLYEYDQNKDNSNTTKNYKNTFGRSDGNGGNGIIVNKTDLYFGVESEEGVESDTSSEIVYSTTVSGEGGIVSNVPDTDPILETVIFINTKNIKITDGALLAINQKEDFISQIEISGDNGIVIKKITGEDDDLVVTKQMYIDTDGNAVFAGALSAATGSFTGSITANSGSIGGWTINSDGIFTGTFDESAYTTSGITISNNGSIHSPNFYLDSTGITTKAGNIGGFTIGATSLTAGATTTSVGVTTDAVAFYAGDATPGSAPFRVTREGVLNATGATISGAITATSGTFTGTVNANAGNFTNTITVGSNAEDKISIVGGSTAQGTKIHSGVGEYNNINTGFYLDADGRFSLGDQLRWDGTTLTILGDIEADTGTIGGFSVGADFIRAGADDTKLLLKYNATNPYISIGQSATENAYNYNGIFLGLDSTIPRLSLKSNTNSLLWDGTNLTINGGGTFSGALAAATGSFGSVTIDAAGKITIGNTIIDNNGITAKNGTGEFADTNFSVDPSTGAITSILGFIGGWTIGNTTLSAGTTAGNYLGMSPGAGTASDISFWAGATDNTAANISAAPFRVTKTGVLNATGAIIEGTITATDGRIGSTTDGWDINTNVLESKNDYIKLDAANNKILVGNITLQGAVAEGDSYIGLGKTGYTLSGTAGIYAGLDNGVAKLSIGNTTNSLTWDGVDLSVTGQITATSGAIAGFTIEDTILTAGSLSAGASGSNVGLTPDSGASDISIWAGASIATGTVPTDAEIAAAPFTVSKTGALKATDGLIGGWTIQPTRLSSAEINLVANIQNSYISIGQTVEGYSEDGIFIGSINADEETKIPAFSLEITNIVDSQQFEGTYTQGDTLIDNWTSSSGVYVNYETAPDTSLVIDDYDIRTDGGLSWAFNNTSGNYFLMKGLTGSTSINQTLEFDLTTAGIGDSYTVSFRYNIARLGGASSSVELRVGTNLNSSIRTLRSTGGNWRSESVTIPAGSSKIIFTFIKTTSGDVLGLIGLDEVVIKKISGLSYNTDAGINITGGKIARFNVSGSSISLGTNTFNSTSTGIYLDASGNFSLKDAFTYNGTDLKLKNPIINGTDIIFEGAVDNSITTTLRVVEPTSTSKVITLPNLTGTVALINAVQTYTSEPIFSSGAVFGSAANEANSIEITSTGNIIFEGSTADGNEIILTAANATTSDKTITLPDLSGTIALNDAVQTFSAIKTFSAEPVLTAGAIFGSAADAANSIEITSSGSIIFEGATANSFETILNAEDSTADRTIKLPNAGGSIAVISQNNTANLQFKTGRYDASIATDARVTITFTTAFPVGLTYGVIATGHRADGASLAGTNYVYGVDTISNTGFSFANDQSTLTEGFSWIAFAY
jgi:hypothetical protein